MVTGEVNSENDATVRLVILGRNGRAKEIGAVIDTGFSGCLTLPSEIVGQLRLPWVSRQSGILADGSETFFDVYAATVVWDGKPRVVEVERANTDPLLGMSLLRGHSLRMDVMNRGRVTIEALRRFKRGKN